ncbi:MAG: MarR family winged helix-turn-helix transcriptional regulator [Candidatus Kapaibacterium sp.]
MAIKINRRRTDQDIRDLDEFLTYEDLQDFSGFMMWQLTHLWQRKINSEVGKVGLTYVQYVLLAALDWGLENGVEPTQINLAKGTKLDKMMTSNVIRTLEKKGLVKRKKHPTDSRALLLSITDKGYDILPKAIDIVEKFNDSFFNKLGDDLPRFKKNMYELLDKNL